MSNIHIPPAALEAGAKVLADINGWRDEQGLIACMPVARLCFLAMIEAWEGMATYSAGINGPYPYLILPLTENPDDKA